MRYYLISLGCPKNAVDAESIGALLDEAGLEAVFEPDLADVLLVNTCCFIASARDESIQVLADLAAQKRDDQWLLAIGCLAQRSGESLTREVPGIDGVLGTRRWSEILPILIQLDRRRDQTRPVTLIGDSLAAKPEQMHRVAIQGASAYLKIADGCSAACAYCAIPLIKGPLHSRPAEEILADARYLAERGTQEAILIAQDTTAYGRDRGERDALPDLLDALVEAMPPVPWIRLMYAYPQHITPRLIETIARHPQICHYLDLPLQHAHPDALRRMCRPTDVDRVRQLIDDLRQAMPDIALRTSFIVGFPGETEAEFRALEAFVDQIQFDKVGVFTYSREEGTPAYDLPDQVPDPVQQERYDRLMARQQAISLARNEAQIDRTLQVLIEGQGEIDYEGEDEPVPISIGRSYRDAPEIDGLVLVEEVIEPGHMVAVEISGAMEYDLIGIVAES